METDRKQVDYATSLYQSYFSKATECYQAKCKNIYLDDESLTASYNTYTYTDGAKEYGTVQVNSSISSPPDTMVAIWHNNDEPITTTPYPHYLGLEFTIESIVSLVMLVNGVEDETQKRTLISEIQIVIDGEGTLIMPDNKKYTDVLRYKTTIADNHVQYTYKSKEFGDIIGLSHDGDGYIRIVHF